MSQQYFEVMELVLKVHCVEKKNTDFLKNVSPEEKSRITFIGIY